MNKCTNILHTHTHIHTHIYIYCFIQIIYSSVVNIIVIYKVLKSPRNACIYIYIYIYMIIYAESLQTSNFSVG